MSDHHTNQYHRQQRRHQQHPYPVGMQGREQHHPQHQHPQHQHPQHHHPQHYHQMGGPPPQQGPHPPQPPLPPGLHHHAIPSSNSSASAAEDSRGSSSNNKRPAASMSSSLQNSNANSNSNSNAGISSPLASSIDAGVVAQTPSPAATPSSTTNNNNTSTTPPSSTSTTHPRSAKKAKKSSPRSSPTSSGNSVTATVKSTGTTSAARGLRHFSMMVCQKVEEKGTTTYNEVADELVKKVVAERHQEDPNGSFDQKNIRRRVYDALNVLMAMDIISKQKKEITWKGLPTAAKHDMDSMTKEIEYRQHQIAQKKEALKDLLTQQVCFRNLVQRNQQREKTSSSSVSQQHSQSQSRGTPEEMIPLPFIVVNTNQSAVIQCDMSRDRTNVMFDFSLPFEINDDNTILKKMHMDRTSMSTLRQMLPEELLHYCESNRLTDVVLGRTDRHDEPQPLSQQHHRLESSPHEVVPPHLSHQQHLHPQHQQPQHPSDRRGSISIEGSSSSSGRQGGRMGRLHEHHQPQHAPPPPHALYHHPYDPHHPGRIPRRSGYPHQQHAPPQGPAIVPSSVSSSRRGIRDPYSY